MDALIPLPYAIVAALVTLAGGYVFALITTDNRHRKLAVQREHKLREEYSNYQRQVTEHFSESSKLFTQVTEQYRRLYHHMADGAQLLGGTPPTPMLQKLEEEHAAISRNRQARTEPTISEFGLDNALVELRDDLHKFTSRLGTEHPDTTPEQSPNEAVLVTNETHSDSETPSHKTPSLVHRDLIPPGATSTPGAQGKKVSRPRPAHRVAGTAKPDSHRNRAVARSKNSGAAGEVEAIKWRRFAGERVQPAG